MRRVVGVIVILAFVLGTSLGLAAAERNGKALFEAKCWKCHTGTGKARKIMPAKYAAVQWERFFDQNQHSRRYDLSTEFTPDELNAVKAYLVTHAADSDQPEAAGLR